MELLNIELSNDPAIPPGIYPEKNHNSKGHMHPSVHCTLFTIARTWKQPEYPITDEWIQKW